jgi:hypothetical protein
MQLGHHIEALQADLAELAGLGDEATAEAARRLSLTLRSALGLRLLDALTEAALELSAQLPSGHVEVRMAGQEPEFVLVQEEPESATAGDDAALSARITLRLPEGLKASVEAAASREGVSVNAWLVRALARSVGASAATTSRGPGSRLTGYARS